MSFDHEGEQSADRHNADPYNADPYNADPDNALEQAEIPPSKGSKKWIGAAAAAAMVVVLTVGGVAFIKVMGGGGAQPEDVLPANAFAFARVDLNPSPGQKLAVYQLISKFPKAKNKVTSQETSVKEILFGSVLTGLNYKTDLEPWLGDRMGVGAFPDMDADKKPEVGVAIAFTDQVAAKAAMDKLVAKSAAKKHKVGYAFADEYVILSDTTAHATTLVSGGKASPLAGSKYGEDVQKLGLDQIAVAWLDLGPGFEALLASDVLKGLVPKSQLNLLKGKNDPSKTTGRIVQGLHADPSYLELTARGIDLQGADQLVTADVGTETRMLASFPAEVTGALTVTGLGARMAPLFTPVTSAADPMSIQPMLRKLGLDSAKKLETLLGAETGFMVGGSLASRPQFAVRTRGGDPDTALILGRKALAGACACFTGLPPTAPGKALHVRKITGPDGLVVGTSAGAGYDLTKALFNKSGKKLGSTESFRQVIPDAEKANFALYVNLAKIVPLLTKDPKLAKEAASLKQLNAFGMTASGGAEPTVRLRLSFK